MARTSATPYLISEALLSNTGGVATLVGDPPNVLIGSAANLSFTDFLVHALPVVLVCWVAALALLLFLFRKELRIVPENHEAVMKMIPSEALNDRRTAMRVLVIIGGAIALFFLHSLLDLTPSYVALSAAAVALIVVRPSMDETFKNVEWNVLLFFIGLSGVACAVYFLHERTAGRVIPYGKIEHDEAAKKRQAAAEAEARGESPPE